MRRPSAGATRGHPSSSRGRRRQRYNACGATTTCAANAGGNVLWIQHQDGSFVRYVHPNQNKIVPAVGDYVHRGNLVVYVGMTGFTTGPHLHVGPRTELVGSGSTNRARFEGSIPRTTRCRSPATPRSPTARRGRATASRRGRCDRTTNAVAARHASHPPRALAPVLAIHSPAPPARWLQVGVVHGRGGRHHK